MIGLVAPLGTSVLAETLFCLLLGFAASLQHVPLTRECLASVEIAESDGGTCLKSRWNSFEIMQGWWTQLTENSVLLRIRDQVFAQPFSKLRKTFQSDTKAWKNPRHEWVALSCE